jgi:hypothetical protein
MKKWHLLLILLLMGSSLAAQPPYLITATNYASGFFGVIADENGQPLAVGSVIHFVWDAAGDGMDDPSTSPGFWGMPTDDDVLIGIGSVGVTGGAPGAGSFVLPGSVGAASGWLYLRAFHAATLMQGVYYSESTSEYAIPLMNSPYIYGVEFPDQMTRRLGIATAVLVSAAPVNPPVIIAPNGGNFQYDVSLRNTTTGTVGFDVWIDVILPNGSVYGPLFSRPGLNMPAQTTWTRQLTQSVPAAAPPGIYSYRVRAGNQHTGTVIHEDAFPFEKQGAGGSDGLLSGAQGWELNGWEEGELFAAPIPEVYFLSQPYPNPFNPSAQIQFGLPEATNVRIDVYNILGSRVVTLLDRHLNAGYHSLIWDAGEYASGLYLVQMKAGGYLHTEKALLVK